MSFTEQLAETIGERIEEAQREIAALEQALAALTAPASPRAAGAGPRPERLPQSQPEPGPEPEPERPPEPEPVVQPEPEPEPAVQRVPAPEPAVQRVPEPEPEPDPGPERVERRERLPRGPLIEQLERALAEAEEGLSAIALAKRIGIPYNQAVELLGSLESAGVVRRSGAGSRWRLVTEEERIARRTAELERLRHG